MEWGGLALKEFQLNVPIILPSSFVTLMLQLTRDSLNWIERQKPRVIFISNVVKRKDARNERNKIEYKYE